MNPIYPYCYYCTNGTPLQVGREVVCSFAKKDLKEWDDTCDQWKLGSLSHIKRAPVGIVPCLRCENFEFFHQIMRSSCRIIKNKDLTIISTCSSSIDQGYNYGIPGEALHRALDDALVVVEARVTKENAKYKDWALKEYTEAEVIAKCAKALTPKNNRGNPVLLNAFKAEFYLIKGMDDYLGLSKYERRIVRGVQKAISFKFTKFNKTANQKGLSLKTIQLNAFARLVLPHI